MKCEIKSNYEKKKSFNDEIISKKDA